LTEDLVYAPKTTKLTTPRVDAVRGFVFTTGLRWLREHDLVDRYVEHLPESLRASVGTMTATEWIPLDLALQCYAACDALNLSVEEQIDVGRTVSAANNGVVVTTIVRLIGGLGATPWLGLRHIDKVWHRSNRGGAVAVFRESDRAARLEFWRVPMAASRFFVTSMRGAVAVGVEALCDRVLVSELPGYAEEDGFALRVVW
jgi:hypothetical protein